MFDKRLFSLADGVGRLVAAKVACQWLGLVANIAFVVAAARMLQPLFAVVAPATVPCLVVIAIAAIVRFLSARAAAHFGTEAAERVKLALREKLFDKMLALGPSYAQRVRTADVVQSAGEGIEQIQSFFELFLPQLFYAILAPITLFAVLAPIDMPTAATLLACAPLIVIIVGMVAMRASRVFKKYWGEYTDMGASFLDNLQGLETLKNFDVDAQAARVMDEKAERFRVMTMNVLQIQLRSFTAMDAVAYGGAAAGIGVAIWRFWSGSLTPSGSLFGAVPLGLVPISAVLLAILLSADFFIPLRQLGSYFHVAMNGMTSTKRIFALLDAPEPERGGGELPEFGASGQCVGVKFRGVSYRYMDADGMGSGATHARADGAEHARYALRDVSFHALPYQVTAIVGPSGSGKSTAVQLLAGTLTGCEGDVELEGMPVEALDGGRVLANGETPKSYPIRDLATASLTREISIVGAHSHLFAGTLRSNLLMARSDATDDELWQALQAAHIDDFVRAQSQELDMPIAQDGSNLSGGQKQRIAIARVLLRRSAIYIFDEATSSVDMESETLILRTIRALADAGRTVLMVTHRMANAADADHVVVFERGTVVEQGVHDDLMAADGTYAKLFHAQENVERVGRRGTPTVSRLSCASRASHASVSPESDNHGAGRGSYASVSGESDVHVSENGAQMSVSGESDTRTLGLRTQMPVSPESDMPTSDIIARLLREVSPLRKCMVIACVCGVTGHLAATFLPVFGVIALFAATGAKIWNLSLPVAVAAMIICALIRGGMRYAEQYMNHNVAFRLLALFRSKAFAALRRLAPAKLSGKGKGGLIALVTTDVELLEIFFAHTISPVVIAIATTLLYTVVLLTLNLAIAVALLAAHLVVGVALPKLFAASVGGLGGDIRGQSARLDDEMLDDMRGLDEIIRFDQGDSRLAGIVSRTRSLWAERARLSAKNGDFAGFGAMSVVLFTAVGALLAMVSSGATMPIAESISTLVSTTAISPSAVRLVVAFVLLASSFGPTLALSALPANLTQTFAAARRLFALMDEAPAVTENGDFLPRYHGMSMHDVTFSYAGSADSDSPSVADPILDGVSFDVPQRGIFGVQGPSGRGKSTLLKLLMRYWDPDSGLVALSEVPLPQVDAHHRRRLQAMMGQETYLFDGTIRENLLMACDLGDSAVSAESDNQSSRSGAQLSVSAESDNQSSRSGAQLSVSAESDNQSSQSGSYVSVSAESDTCASRLGAQLSALPAPPASDDVLRAALAKASALDLVDSLPKGLDTPVGELGGRLSEGERQRIGLARIFLRHASLVLFDEPTSRLDAYNESVILQSIGALPQRGSAVMLVSHRDSTMRIADHIVRI